MVAETIFIIIYIICYIAREAFNADAIVYSIVQVMVKFNGFRLLDISRPTKKDAKYAALVLTSNGEVKLVNFGSRSYQHYRDTTPLKLWSHLDHNDKTRRDLFYARHKNNNGIAGQLSKAFLWT